MKLISVIEYQGSNDVLIYKFPEEEFNTSSKLIVRPSQEAIFIRGGQMADSMPPGTYTLKTGNIPILSRLINIPTGGQSPFQASVYFVNKTMAWDMKWGIPEQIRILDPIYGMPVNASASGSMAVQIAEPRRFLEKMVGTSDVVTKDMLQGQFRSLITAKVKKALSQLLRKFGFETMNEYLEELSISLSPDISAEMEDYGVKLQKFLIDRIKLDDTDVARIDQQTITNYSFRAELERKKAAQIQEIELEAMHRKQEADANAYQTRTEGYAQTDVEADRMKREGYSFRDRGIIEVLKLYAANEHAGAGGSAEMFAQAPMAFAMGGAMAQAAQPVFQGFQNQAQAAADIFSQPSAIFGDQSGPSSPAAPASGSAHAADGGEHGPERSHPGHALTEDNSPAAAPAPDGRPGSDALSHPANDKSSAPDGMETAGDTNREDPVKVLQQLKQLLDLGIVSQEEFDAKKAEVLSRM